MLSSVGCCRRLLGGWWWCSAVLLVALLTTLPAQEMTRRCSRPILRNGNVQIRLRNRIARFQCSPDFRMSGPKSITCSNGRWDSEPPICVRPGCARLVAPANGLLYPTFRGAVVLVACNDGFVMNGPRSLYCDGRTWNGTLPECMAPDKEPATFCDFDNDDLCDWTQDKTDDADWIQHSFSVPSRPTGTGPKFDHTFGEGLGGRYMYTESSSPRTVNDSARFLSPMYPATMATNDSCFIFWYHMFGASMGYLRLYQKEKNKSIINTEPSFELKGNQGDQWLQRVVMLKPSTAPFQMVIEAVRGPSYLSDVAIDDVSFEMGDNCTVSSQSNSDAEDPRSCQWRCEEYKRDAASDETPAMPSCGCEQDCENSHTCCPDYWQYCTQGRTEIMLVPSPLVTSSTTSASLTSLLTTLNSSVPASTAAPPANASGSPLTTGTAKTPPTINITTTISDKPVTMKTENITKLAPTKNNMNTTLGFLITSTTSVITSVTPMSTLKQTISTSLTTPIPTTTKSTILTQKAITRISVNTITTLKPTTVAFIKTSPVKLTTMSTSKMTLVPKTLSTSKITAVFTTKTIKTSPKPTQKVTTTTQTTAKTMTPPILEPTFTTATTSNKKKSESETAALGGDGPSDTTTTAADLSPSMTVLAAVAAGAVLLLLLVGVATVVVRRRRWRRMRGRDSDDSDVRFLTASDGEIQLDFSLASPSSN